MSISKNLKVIAIDGPAGSGKSTVSKLVADRLGYMYIDTGAMYRALTLKIMKENVDFSDEGRIIDISQNIDIKLSQSEKSGEVIHVFLCGEDVSEEIRKMEVSGNIKHVAKIPKVRENLVNLQRQMVKEGSGAVMEGRDIGTVVLKDAKHKFYVDAAFEERVSRRLMELQAKGIEITVEEVAEDLRQRDHSDKTRKVGPLKKAEDAIFVDTTALTIDQVVAKIVQFVNAG